MEYIWSVLWKEEKRQWINISYGNDVKRIEWRIRNNNKYCTKKNICIIKYNNVRHSLLIFVKVKKEDKDKIRKPPSILLHSASFKNTTLDRDRLSY